MLKYPESPRTDKVDIIHGVRVPDPYRWLEDIDSQQTQDWIEAENKVAFGYLEQIPAREKIRQRIAELWDYEKYGTPFRRGERYFIFRNDGLQNQDVLYWMESLEDEPRVLLDPNKLSEDGTVSLRDFAVSEDGKLLAYGLSASGSDWMEWQIREVDTGRDMTDHLKWVKFSGASWTHDGGGFFYSRYDAPEEGTAYKRANYYQKLYYHRIGTPQSQDELVYERPDQKEWHLGGSVTEDGRYLIIAVLHRAGRGSENGVFYTNLQADDGEIVELLREFDASYSFIGNDGPVFYFMTDLDAPMSRVIAIDINKPESPNWEQIIPESSDALMSVSLVNDMFAASYLHDAYSLVKIFDMTGKPVREVEFPGIGTVHGFSATNTPFLGRRRDKEIFYCFTGFTTPGTIYRYDMETGESTLFREPEVDFDPDAYVTEQVFYHSKDGTQVPMFICHKKGLKLDGSNPTYLYGYGGFNIPLTPDFSISNLAWMEMDGIFAQPNLRGGGAYGKSW
jgi:prolyl oligopeptidase